MMNYSIAIPDEATTYVVQIAHVYRGEDHDVCWDVAPDSINRFGDQPSLPEEGEIVVFNDQLYRVADIGWEYLGMQPDDMLHDIRPTVVVTLFVVHAWDVAGLYFRGNDGIGAIT